MIEVKHSLTSEHFQDLMSLYKNTYWAADRSEEEVRRMLEHTDILFALVDSDDGHLVGFARVLTDTVYKALIFDVIIHPDHRGSGLARVLLDKIMAYPDLKNIKNIRAILSQ